LQFLLNYKKDLQKLQILASSPNHFINYLQNIQKTQIYVRKSVLLYAELNVILPKINLKKIKL